LTAWQLPIHFAHDDIKKPIFPRKTGTFQRRCTFDAPFGEDSELETRLAV